MKFCNNHLVYLTLNSEIIAEGIMPYGNQSSILSRSYSISISPEALSKSNNFLKLGGHL